MSYAVVATRDIVNETDGSLLVKKGTQGLATAYAIASGDPGEVPKKRRLTYTVDFSNAGTLQVSHDSVQFVNGSVALLELLVKDQTIEGLDNNRPVSNAGADLAVGVRIRLASGLNVSITADYASGLLRFEFDAD